MFRLDNTEGFTEAELTKLNSELEERLASKELDGLDEYDREKIISEDIMRRF